MSDPGFIDGKPTIYLDWSVFQTGYEGSLIKSEPWKREITALIYRCGQEAHLCFSAVHIFDFMSGNNKIEINAKAAWLEHLPLSFVKSTCRIWMEELRIFGNREFDQKYPNLDIRAFSFFSMFPEDLPVSIASKATFSKKFGYIYSLADEAFDFAKSEENGSVRWMREESTNASARIATLISKSSSVLNDSSKRRDHLIRSASEITPEFFIKKSGKIPSEEAELTGLAPFFMTTMRTVGKSASRLSRSVPNSKNFKGNQSNLCDWQHLVGAAYCTVYTCDKKTRADLGGIRAELGFSDALLPPTRKTAAEFISAVERCLRRTA